jgi:hypothetical protein
MHAILRSKVTMSKLNGDKARFHRLRKAGLRRREHARQTWAAERGRVVPIDPGSVSEPLGGVRVVAPGK